MTINTEGRARSMERQDRKDAAVKAAEMFQKRRDGHKDRLKEDMSEHELAETAIDAKQAAEKEFGIRISATVDVDGNWWFA